MSKCHRFSHLYKIHALWAFQYNFLLPQTQWGNFCKWPLNDQIILKDLRRSWIWSQLWPICSPICWFHEYRWIFKLQVLRKQLSSFYKVSFSRILKLQVRFLLMFDSTSKVSSFICLKAYFKTIWTLQSLLNRNSIVKNSLSRLILHQANWPPNFTPILKI